MSCLEITNLDMMESILLTVILLIAVELIVEYIEDAQRK